MVPNLVRGLVPTGIDQIGVADITYIRLARQFIYLAVVLDAHSRKVVGWALAEHFEAAWLSKRSTWRWRPAVPRAVSSTTPTAACNMPATNIANGGRPTGSQPA